MEKERERIERMLREGKITKEQSEKLLKALEESAVAEKEKEEFKMEQETIKRSRGVTVFGVIAIIFGSLGTLGSCFGWIIFIERGPLLMQALEQYGLSLDQMTTFLIHIIVGTIVSILFLVSGIGILKLREWARRLIPWTAVAFIAARVIQTATGLFGANKYIALFKIISALIFWGLIIWFFNRTSIKAQFQKL